MLNYKLVLNVSSRLIILVGILMLTSLPYSIFYGGEDLLAFIYSSIITIVFGIALFLLTRSKDYNLGKKEGYFIVTLSWIVISLFGALPFLLSGVIPNYTDAFFETISGFTTTGASILTDIESLPKGLLYWRSMTQWIGGMGIIVLTVAIIPFLGIGGMQLFVAEVPGPAPDKLHPRVKETAKRLWGVYVIFTLVEFILLWIGGMTPFDAICHSFTTMATGGYSTKNASIAAFEQPFIHYVIIIFMFIAGTNFTLSYFALSGKFKKIIKNQEFKLYFGIIIVAGVIITAVLVILNKSPFEKAIRDSLFQVVSITTTTGFVTADYDKWFPLARMLIILLFFAGGCAGSTGGSIKIIRHLVLFRNMSLEFRRLIHPRAVIPVRYNGKVVPSWIVSNIITFFFLYVIIFVLSTIIMTFLGLDLESSIGAVAASIGNVGPGIGSVGPVCNFAHVSDLSKWFLSFLMLLGRLELFTVLILFARGFWRQ